MSSAPEQSLLSWMVNALGIYAILLPLAGLIAFVLSLAIILRGKGPMAAAALILVVHAPLLIGVFGAVEGSFASYFRMAHGERISPSMLAEDVATSQTAPLLALLVMAPSYGVAAIGAFMRAMTAKTDSTKS